MEDVVAMASDRLQWYRFPVLWLDIFDKLAPPDKMVYAIIEIKKRAAIGTIKIEAVEKHWLAVDLTLYGEIDGQTKGFCGNMPKNMRCAVNKQNNQFTANYQVSFPSHSAKTDIQTAVVALAEFRKAKLPLIRDFCFNNPIWIDILPPGCWQAKKLAGMGALAKPFAMSWLLAQAPHKFSEAQKAELEAMAAKHKWAFKQGNPIFNK